LEIDGQHPLMAGVALPVEVDNVVNLRR